MLIADARPTDIARTARLVLGWLEGDKVAVDHVLDEAANDPLGTAGLVICLTEYAARLTQSVAPDGWGERLRRLILENVRADEQ